MTLIVLRGLHDTFVSPAFQHVGVPAPHVDVLALREPQPAREAYE